eukprot:TRINITY_DN20263_c0_g1_i1.p1 TRINITY_DN20263_c0_g1~~TRINITY_DN20263_c0_g1_i1.p1  ORF type:complete len:286 (-),score=38.48 TRINITY_DN20263_c0_g1_i1:118-975(-)
MSLANLSSTRSVSSNNIQGPAQKKIGIIQTKLAKIGIPKGSIKYYMNAEDIRDSFFLANMAGEFLIEVKLLISTRNLACYRREGEKVLGPPHLGLRIGPFIIHWDLCGLVRMIRDDQFLHLTAMPVRTYDRSEFEESYLFSICETIARWNSTYTHSPRHTSQHFVEEILAVLGESNFFGESLTEFLKTLASLDLPELDFSWIFSDGSICTIKSHAQFDYEVAIRGIGFGNPDYEMLIALDNAFWFRYELRGKDMDTPLLSEDGRIECPFRYQTSKSDIEKHKNKI